MTEDFEDLYDLPSLDDEEIRELIFDQLSEHSQIDPDDIEVEVHNGHVRLLGRVVSERDYQALEHVVSEVIGVEWLSNEVVVDELPREEQPEAAVDAVAARLAVEPAQRGGANRTEESAEHLLHDTASELSGTDDPREAVERGYSYNLPTEPAQEGSWSKEEE